MDFFFPLFHVYLQYTDTLLEAFSIVNHFIAAASRVDNTRNDEIWVCSLYLRSAVLRCRCAAVQPLRVYFFSAFLPLALRVFNW